MFVELIEVLRCPVEHDDSPLVVSASRTEARHVLNGTLGCPMCRAEFTIRDGEAWFVPPEEQPHAAAPVSADPEIGMQLAAFLQLTDARGYAILCGVWGAHASEVRRLTTTPLMLVNPSGTVDVEAAGVIRVHERVPLARASARAAALDDATSDALSQAIVASVSTGGRVLAPTSRQMPAGLVELARDHHVWIAEKRATPDEPAPRLVSLRRA